MTCNHINNYKDNSKKITSINITKENTSMKFGGVFIGCMAASTVSTIIEAHSLHNTLGVQLSSCWPY